MKDNSLTEKTMSGMIWKLSEKVGAQLMQVIIQVVLARLLMPEEYGLVGLISVFIVILDVFILQGLTTALIQKKDPDELDFSSVFFSNMVMSVFLYGLCYLVAPVVAAFYKEPKLVGIMRVLSLNVVIGAFPAVHNAILSRELDFRKSFFRNIANTLTQGVVGVTLAYYGLGAWAMVFSRLMGNLIGAIVLWLTVAWRPSRVFSFQRVQLLFVFSSKVLGTNLLNTLYNNIHALIIGRFYSAVEVGFYQRGQQFPQAIMVSLDGSMTEVLYPVFSKIQNDKNALKYSLRKSIAISMFVTLPVMSGLAVVAKPLVFLLLTEKWLPCVPFMQLFCINCMFWPLSHRVHAINAIGRSDITLKLSVISKGITTVLLIVSIPLGIYSMMCSSIFSSIINVFISSYYVKKEIGYCYGELVEDVLPSVLLSIAMSMFVLVVSRLLGDALLGLLVQILVGAVFYSALSILFKIEAAMELINLLKKMIFAKKKEKYALIRKEKEQ